MRERKQIHNRERQHRDLEMTRDDPERPGHLGGRDVAVVAKQQACGDRQCRRFHFAGRYR